MTISTDKLRSRPPGSVTLLLGENGSGKSFLLRKFAAELIRDGESVIAVSNSVFDRFPPNRKGSNYSHLSPARGPSYALNAFKNSLCTEHLEDQQRRFEMVAKSLDYAGFSPVIAASTEKVNLPGQEPRVKLPDVPGMEAAHLLAALDRIDSVHRVVIDFSVRSEVGLDRDMLLLLKHEKVLKKAGLIKRIDLELRKGKSWFPLARASSGELTLLACNIFIGSAISRGSVLLFDEPENSLHPRWQSNWCNQVLDQFYLYSPRVYAATHSPILVSGAESGELKPGIISLSGQSTDAETPKSIDGILMEAFRVLPPASHYLSEKVTELLNELSYRRIDLDKMKQELHMLKGMSYDKPQIEFLDQVASLAENVASLPPPEATNEARGHDI